MLTKIGKGIVAYILVALVIIMSWSMATSSYAGQWKQDNTGWWYQNNDGSYSRNSWQWIGRKCYYFNENGYCLINAKTPDGYTVDNNGAWHINGEVQVQPISFAVAGRYYMMWGDGRSSDGVATLNINYLRDTDRFLTTFNGYHKILSNGEFVNTYTGEIEGELYRLEGKPLLFGFHPYEWDSMELLFFITYHEGSDSVVVELVGGKDQSYFIGLGFPGFVGSYERSLDN